MASVVLKDVKTCRKGKAVIRVVSLTDVEVQERYGSQGQIKEKIQLALRRKEQGSVECTSC
jgi:hypothetical protein